MSVQGSQSVDFSGQSVPGETRLISIRTIDEKVDKREFISERLRLLRKIDFPNVGVGLKNCSFVNFVIHINA